MSRKYSYFIFLHWSGNLRIFFRKNLQFWNHSVISLNFNFQYNREFLRYKALKKRFGQGPLLLQKYKIYVKEKELTSVYLAKSVLNYKKSHWKTMTFRNIREQKRRLRRVTIPCILKDDCLLTYLTIISRTKHLCCFIFPTKVISIA